MTDNRAQIVIDKANGELPGEPGPSVARGIDRRAIVSGAAGLAVGASLGATAVGGQAQVPVHPADIATLSVHDFGAKGDGKAADGDAIRAALAAADALDYREKRIVFPAGEYRIDKIDLTGTRGIVFVAEGTVQLAGTGGAFIVGSERHAREGDDGSVYNFRMEGSQWLIAPEPGAEYRHAMQLYGLVQSSLSNISVSGEFGRGEFERVAVTIDRSWANRFEGLAVACPGLPGPGRKSIAIRCEIDNVNVNTFNSCRIVGIIGKPDLAGTIGMVVNGSANRVVNCDVSAVEIGIELVAARGCMLMGNYHEAVQRCVVARRGNSRGCTIVGGFYAVAPDGVALSLGSSQSTTIMGGWYRGTGGGTFIDRGDACYGLSVIEPVLEDVGTTYRGIERGALTPGAAATRISAAGVVFPEPEVRSDHSRTLDDYNEGVFAPRGDGFAFVDGSAAFTKIGNIVHLRFRIAFPPSGSRREAALVGLPFAAADGEGAGVVLGDQRNPNGNAIAVRGNRLVVIDPRTGKARANAEVAGDMYSGVATYAVAGR
ncbi:hypothetical protein N0B51_02160 [Tsuneonella sp. YG55]|uniref:Rhamnogalacturonase A/B/Epimerase-like pectate lyase domain-containing protein n=1 Tax=Tsuneonella litorea TaxID=2976475 RepID=A0A9X3AK18_9SPHN|nr:glycosyl hydrolase family 28-related protein [Tsuneonella litorea]MCT2557779.1 hypothetical protein [Tsuneonella litorea]